MHSETENKQDQSVNEDHAPPVDEVQFYDAWNERLKLDIRPSPTEFEF